MGSEKENVFNHSTFNYHNDYATKKPMKTHGFWESA